MMKTPFSATRIAQSTLGAAACLLCASSAYAQALPDGWLAADVGSPAIAGSTTFDQNSSEFAITAAGQDIWGRSDQFHFLYQPAEGDFVAETGNISEILPFGVPLDPWAKAGVMIRESLAANSPYVFLTNTGANGLRIQYRSAPGAPSRDFAFEYGPNLGQNQLFLGIERRDDTFLFKVSSNQGGLFDPRGVRLVGSIEVPMADRVFAGTAVTSHDASSPITARVQRFSTEIRSLEEFAPEPTFAVNAGSSIGYEEFGPDRDFTGQTRTFSVGASTPIAGTDLDPVYRSERWGADFAYRIALEQGRYYVRLLMAEIYFNRAGARVFDVAVENQLVAEDLDLYAEVGKFAAYTIEAPDVFVGSDGVLDIEFDASVNNAKVSGILVNEAPALLGSGGLTPTYTDLEPKVLFPLEVVSDEDGPERLFIKEVVTFPARYSATGTLEIVGDAVVYTPSPQTPFLGPSIFSESFEVVVSDGLSETSIFYYPYFE